MVVTVELDQNLFPSTASFRASIDNSISDVGVVINDYYQHLRGEGPGAEYSSKSSMIVM